MWWWEGTDGMPDTAHVKHGTGRGNDAFGGHDKKGGTITTLHWSLLWWSC